MKPKVLIVEDDLRLAEMLVPYLESQGFSPVHLDRGREVLRKVQTESFELLLLDVMLPDADGFTLCKEVRQVSHVPIIMLTARGEQTDRVVGLEIGADDYLAKPYDPRELVARMRAVLRRTAYGAGVGAGNESGEEEGVLQFGALRIDMTGRRLWRDDQLLDLTSRQFDLLCLLVERKGRVQSRGALTEALTGDSWDVEDRSIDVHISRIRSAIEVDPKKPEYIKSVRGAGYVFTGTGGSAADADETT